MRFNPFQPNNIVAPGIFTGRVDELRMIENCIFQARYSNPQHFLLEGERGIGKSSLVNLVGKMGRGDFDLTSKLNFLVVSIDVGGVHSQVDLVKKLARELKGELSRAGTLRQRASQVWDFLSKWEILGVRYHRDAAPDPDDAREALVDQLVALVDAMQGERDGVLFLIDEADAAPVEAQLGEFLKSVSERLAKRDCANVLFGLAGLPSTIGSW